MFLDLIFSLDSKEILETNVINILLLLILLFIAGKGTLTSNLNLRRAQIYNTFFDMETRLSESQTRLELCQAVWMQAEVSIYSCLAERNELEQRFFINKTKKFLTKLTNFISRFRTITLSQGNLCSELTKKDLLEFLSWCINEEIEKLTKKSNFKVIYKLMLIRSILKMHRQKGLVLDRVKSIEMM